MNWSKPRSVPVTARLALRETVFFLEEEEEEEVEFFCFDHRRRSNRIRLRVLAVFLLA